MSCISGLATQCPWRIRSAIRHKPQNQQIAAQETPLERLAPAQATWPRHGEDMTWSTRPPPDAHLPLGHTFGTLAHALASWGSLSWAAFRTLGRHTVGSVATLPELLIWGFASPYDSCCCPVTLLCCFLAASLVAITRSPREGFWLSVMPLVGRRVLALATQHLEEGNDRRDGLVVGGKLDKLYPLLSLRQRTSGSIGKSRFGMGRGGRLHTKLVLRTEHHASSDGGASK
ncbi:hypothetical protein BKA56DRAFT_577022 [Ilyonectria sp. MPI-CAGE-AT-0026]|nr:hypothetical protein BKA56DRAFT_577022 [Ilyonectria sp. MPI-CAGE-AT-0026]